MTSKRKFVKKAISVGLSATLALSAVGFSALAATSKDSVFPVTKGAQPVDDTVLTTLSQRAASEIPLVFGINVVDGDLFSGYIDMGGSDVSENLDPYVYNYNIGSSSDAYLGTLGRTGLENADGLYNSGGANQVYDSSVSYGIDVIVGFNSDVFDSITDEEDYAPVIIDVQTGSATSRLYAWAEMGYALSNYLSSSKTVRYGEPYTTAVNLEQFSAGIPYYISYLIDSNQISKKTAAFVTQEVDGEYTCTDPAGMGDVRSDMFAEAGNFNFIAEGTYTTAQLGAAGVDLVILSATGYSYTGGTTGVKDSLSNQKAEILEDLSGVYGNSMPIVMSGDNYGVTIGNNGYNYSPITCMFLPYVQAYAYMDELSSVNSNINPEALVEYMIDEFFHVDDAYVASVADYYIGDNWTSAASNDTVPTCSTTAYGNSSKTAIESAIKVGIQYALYLQQNNTSSSHTLLAAKRTNDNAYVIINTVTEDDAPDGTENEDYIVLTVDGDTKYLDLETVANDYPGIVEYYESDYNTGWNLKTTLQNYADHMYEHIWNPLTTLSGTYGYKLSALSL